MPQVCPKPKLALVTPGDSRFPTPLGPSAGRDVVSQVPSVDKLHVCLFLDGTARCSVPSQRFLTEIENAKLKGTWTSPALGRVLFRDWFAEWRRTTASLRPNTEARDERLFRLHVLPRFRPVPLAKIGQHDVRTWVAELSTRGLAPSTVQRAYQLLSKVMGAAVDAGMIPRTPCRRVPLPKIDRQEMRFLSPKEVARLAAAIRPDYRALILLGAYGGLRIGEMAGLRRGRVDLTHGTVQVVEVVTEPTGKQHIGPPKTRAVRRTVGLPRFVVEALAGRMNPPGSPEEFVFAGAKGGLLRVSIFRTRIWRPAVNAAGLEGLRIHDLRHTAVALWIAAGANPRKVAARAGHASVSFTLDRYGHLYPEADLTLRERLEAIYAASSDASWPPAAPAQPQATSP
jgi:integrase